MDDPFVSNSSEGVVTPRDVPKFSFDTQLFSLDASSPAQAKRALEAHLAETERRLEEASKLGTALIEQQKSLEEKLKEVEQQQEDGQIGPELRRKLADLEKEYNEIGRETARAFLGPKRLAGGDDAHLGTPSLDPKSPLASVFFAGQATNSPSKVSVPSRKQRNQPSSRVHDIEFATEISTSLLAQVRQLQALLAEREEALKTVNLEKSRLELEAEGYAQRIRVLDESEERYKDENWALETRTHELMAAMKEAADREGRISSHLAAVTSEKNAVERELEDLKQTNAKLVEDHTAAQKANDAEIHLLRRNLNAGDAEKLALQQKVEELNSQNEELAKAVAMRIRQHQQESIREVSLDNDSDDQDQITPENSPPPSPNKFTPRHNHLETETLRSSLGHAHRMIQNLKSTIHREKTEKIELKRMLQEARDEVEQRRREAAAPTGPTSKRQKTKSDSVRKLARPDLLGAGRKGRTEVEVHDTEWEDNAGEGSPSHKSARNVSRGRPEVQSSDEPSDAYHTATEADDAFETANERETATESEAFQTGIESMADDSTDSDELTETEDRVQTTPRGRVSSLTLAKARDRNSFQSTASTSADEDDSEDGGFASPSQNSTPRFRLHKKRSVLRKIRPSGEAPMAYGSRPPSARQSPATSFTQATTASEGQSLFAELAELEGGDGEEEFGPPMQQDTASQASTPRMLPVSDSRRASEISLDTPKPAMVDSGVMTDPWEPVVPTSSEGLGEQPSAPTTPTKPVPVYADMAVETTESPQVVHSATQWTPLKGAPESHDDHVAFVPTPPKMAWDEHAAEERDAAVSLPELNVSEISFEETLPLAPKLPELSTSYFVGGTTEPVELPAPEPLEMVLSAISSQLTEPVTAKLPEPEPKYVPDMALSVVSSEHTLPVVATFPEPTPPAPVAEHGTSTDVTELSVSVISFQQTEPIEATLPEPTPEPEPTVVVDPVVTEAQVPDLTVTFITPECTEPVAPHPKESPRSLASELSLSTIRSVETLPVESTPAISVVPVPAPLPSGENVPPAESRAITADKPTSDAPSVVVAEDSPVDRSVGEWDKTGATRPLSAISGNTVPRHTRRQSSTQTDHGAQTILSSKQIDQILMDRVSSRPLSPPDSDRAKELSNSPFATPKPRTRPSHQSSTTSLHKRPGSAASQTSSIQSHPPLPPDHKEIIMAAEKKSMELRPASPALMGPPLAPASAYRTNSAQRPRTPNESVGQVSSAKSTTSRVKVRRESLASRRSSVSSFASELDERFNINANQAAMAHGYAAGTDPRMIQAITQTMIGEFLWKYTRKTGSSDMSNTRHRRYFWVHPYTRTLYWSTQDPQSAGKSELKTKSVAIEAIRVVADDNPYPPGLHCRSLEVVSPGRRVRFTATTSQRHETWFNALSYLLLRNSENEEDDGNVTLEDIDEFNPGFRSRSRQTARLSISSSQSRTARNWPKQRAGSALSVRHSATPGRLSPALSTPSNYSRRSSSSRLSTILNTTIKGSFGRRGPNHATASLHDGSVHDQNSEEDLRQMMERQEQEADRLENVRACCDGKHDVGSLARTSRYSPRVNRIHSHH
ncbi:anucleate primary sterigmata protein A [Aspergillus terreus NIH2624]|uniref:Anucleate primary sterigmata protein A n=1 Tax=Aspergillus terreus (strain NIH 2624 / FGSC A1156) TaxID=341663 RepID=Q0CD76_ASPTN|nr:anucleate primary sterigmata protein A [Aspergillus terreus NIH2624]EAU31531.1 anucleate primary sterigmata protein A [Aspergillus terreus NIH2624]